MPVSIRSRLLLLTLTWVLPALAAGLWIIDLSVRGWVHVAAMQRSRLGGYLESAPLQVGLIATLLLSLALTGAVHVAHDFNNLLGVISNSAQLQRRQTAALHGAQAMTPQRQLPQARELMQSVLGRGVSLAIEVAPGTAAVTADYSELELALINLALNARDAIGTRRGHVRLIGRNAREGEVSGLPGWPCVCIALSDDGCGIDCAVAEHVFEPFFTTKPAGQGTGLGLTQVHGFCVQAGGLATIDSRPGGGTTVALWLPASDSQAAAVAGPPGPAPYSDSAGDGGEPLADVSILLARLPVVLTSGYSSRMPPAG